MDESRNETVELCLRVIRESFDERMMTEDEAEAVRQALRLPIYNGESRRVPIKGKS